MGEIKKMKFEGKKIFEKKIVKKEKKKWKIEKSKNRKKEH